MFGIFDRLPDEVIGYVGERDGKRITIKRQPGEGLDALQDRAWALVTSRSVFALYVPATAPQCEDLAPPSAWVPEAAPADHRALAGIGRRATRDELIRMGAIHVHPERPV
jgi:hypothetical protein